MSFPPAPDPDAPYDPILGREHTDWLGFPHLTPWLLRMPEWKEDDASCPHCWYRFQPPNVPQKSRHCPQCGDKFWIRKCEDGVRRTLTEGAMIEVECCIAETSAYLNTAMITVTMAGHENELAMEKTEASRVIRRQARARIYAKHARG